MSHLLAPPATISRRCFAAATCSALAPQNVIAPVRFCAIPNTFLPHFCASDYRTFCRTLRQALPEARQRQASLCAIPNACGRVPCRVVTASCRVTVAHLPQVFQTELIRAIAVWQNCRTVDFAALLTHS
ncbi:MAG: hypothetical protein KME12_23485 [Trichocoleus desertorum ATA4-8-CV12]|nr:hypothetical protein [Trichocoleus desertorum ATA4-8-CV12]